MKAHVSLSLSSCEVVQQHTACNSAHPHLCCGICHKLCFITSSVDSRAQSIGVFSAPHKSCILQHLHMLPDLATQGAHRCIEALSTSPPINRCIEALSTSPPINRCMCTCACLLTCRAVDIDDAGPRVVLAGQPGHSLGQLAP